MTSLDKRRQIEHWALAVAACANGIDELRVNDAPETTATERSETTSYGSSIPYSTLRPRKDSHVVRILQPSSSDGSIKSRDYSRKVRSSRPVVANDTSGSTSRSRRAYVDSQESFVRRPKSPQPSRYRPPTPPETYPKYSVIRRISRPAPPELDPNIRYYVDERPWYYKEEQLRGPSKPSKPGKPRPRSTDSRGIYYPRPPSPPIQETVLRSSSPRRTTYSRIYDNPPRRTVSVRGRGETRVLRRREEYDRSNSAKRLNQLYDDVDKLRSIDTRRVLDDFGRGRSFEYSRYDAYDNEDYYDGRR